MSTVLCPEASAVELHFENDESKYSMERSVASYSLMKGLQGRA